MERRFRTNPQTEAMFSSTENSPPRAASAPSSLSASRPPGSAQDGGGPAPRGRCPGARPRRVHDRGRAGRARRGRGGCRSAERRTSSAVRAARNGRLSARVQAAGAGRGGRERNFPDGARPRWGSGRSAAAMLGAGGCGRGAAPREGARRGVGSCCCSPGGAAGGAGGCREAKGPRRALVCPVREQLGFNGAKQPCRCQPRALRKCMEPSIGVLRCPRVRGVRELDPKLRNN